MTPADIDLNIMTRSGLTVAKKPDVCCHSWVFNVGLELRAEFETGHVSGETP